jgi:hypothetical protein
MIRSIAVGINLRCFETSAPSGEKNNAVQYSVPRSRSITPMTSHARCRLAISPSRSVAGPGTSIAPSK